MEVVTGAIVATVAGVLIPFLTTQFSLWSEERRSMVDARRAAVRGLAAAEAAPHVRLAEETDRMEREALVGRVGPNETDNARIRVARDVLIALFTTRERPLLDLLNSEKPSSPFEAAFLTEESRMVLATWAEGRDLRARRSATRLVKANLPARE